MPARLRAGPAALDVCIPPPAPGFLVRASFCTLKRLGSCSAEAARADTADEVRLAVAKRLRHGERSVVHGDLATALRNVEWLWVRRVVADKHVAVSVHEQIRASRREIAVATPQPSVLVAAGLQQALL